MVVGWPQGIYLALVAMSIGVSLARFGQSKQGTYGWTEMLVSPAIALGLLYWGGFFGG